MNWWRGIYFYMRFWFTAQHIQTPSTSYNVFQHRQMSALHQFTFIHYIQALYVCKEKRG